MPLPLKALNQISEADLQSLVDLAEAESKVVEYKEILPGSGDADKKEFLYDVASFANASGGTLLYGIKAVDGVPIELTGIVGMNADAEKLRLQAIIQSGMQPRISQIEIEAINLTSGKKVLLIRIPKSWASPHMVTFKGTTKFYSRHSNGKYQLDVGELRNAFLASDSIGERIAAFRADRISKILGNELPVVMKEGPRIVFHLAPFSAFTHGSPIDLKKLMNFSGGILAPMRVQQGYDYRFNFDGCVFFERFESGSSIGYTQIFRSGTIEIVDASFFQYGQNLIFVEGFAESITKYIPQLLARAKHLEITMPFAAALSLLQVRGYEIYERSRSNFGRVTIDREHLITPVIVIEDINQSIADLLKPAFDTIYNACGRIEFKKGELAP